MAHILKYPPKYVDDDLLATADTLLEELAEEARSYLELLERLKAEPSDYEREHLEGDLYASVSHFKSHSEVTLECLDELTERLPEEDEVHA